MKFSVYTSSFGFIGQRLRPLVCAQPFPASCRGDFLRLNKNLLVTNRNKNLTYFEDGQDRPLQTQEAAAKRCIPEMRGACTVNAAHLDTAQSDCDLYQRFQIALTQQCSVKSLTQATSGNAEGRTQFSTTEIGA